MRNVPLLVDAAFCIVFLPLIIWLMPKEDWMMEKYPVFLYMIVGWLYVIYAVNRRFTVPFLFRGRRWLSQGLGILLLSLCVTYAMSHIEMFSPLYGQPEYSEQYPQRIIKLRLYRQTLWLLFIIAETFSFAVGILTEFYRQRSQKAAIENERDRAELAQYKAQINPHFLFNTLNTLYGLLITQSEKTERAMEQFISLSKYMYNNANRNFISTSEEVDYISQYISLQKLRLNDMADVTFDYDIQHPDAPVPPMLLITFVENAFKYGISSNEACFIHINMVQKGDALLFEAENTVFAREGRQSKKMGIENCRKRLALLYPDGSHTLDISNHDNIFRVKLTLDNKKHTVI